jgi:hypothetical protein
LHTLMSPWAITPGIKWYLISICFILSWNIWSFVRHIALWLSQNIMVQELSPHSSWYKPLNQIAYLHAS